MQYAHHRHHAHYHDRHRHDRHHNRNTRTRFNWVRGCTGDSKLRLDGSGIDMDTRTVDEAKSLSTEGGYTRSLLR